MLKVIDTKDRPLTLGVILAAMQTRREFIAQSPWDSREYWSCQRQLRELEVLWNKAEAVWAKALKEAGKS